MPRFWFLALALIALAGCSPDADAGTKAAAAPEEPANGRTEVFVMGMVHGSHRTSPTYPLGRIRAVVEAIDPDIILTELPTDRYQQALDGFRRTGKVTEARAQAFPEYTDVIIPMTKTHAFEVLGVARWTKAEADGRKAKLAAIERDPARRQQWQAWEASQKAFTDALDGRSSDPLFIHTPEYDRLVEARYAPHERYFDADLGSGGWDATNKAHWANISAALDRIKGQHKRVLITFGAFHKYRILRELKQRKDVVVRDIRPYFVRNPA